MIVTKNLIDKLKNKDSRVFEKIYHEYEGLVFYICYSITLNKEVSEELTQDTFLKLLTSLDNYQEDGHFKQFIMQIARNLSKNYVSRIMNKETSVGEETIFDAYASMDSERENVKTIIELQSILTKEEADVVILKIVYDFKFKEIAEDKNMTLGEVQAIYYRAIEKVRKNYKEAGLI